MSRIKKSLAIRVLGAAAVGIVGGFLGTAVVIGSPEFGILGAIGGAIMSMIATATTFELAEA
jgi:hypothetical protein